MPIERRELLIFMAAAGTLAAGSSSGAGAAEDAAREKVAGIGGFFFRAKDPAVLARWYQDRLGINLTPESHDMQPWKTTAGVTSFTPFPQNTKYIGDESHAWMMNFRVNDLEKLAAQLRAEGVEVKVDPKTYPYGRFARLHDPEGNAIELWQPM